MKILMIHHSGILGGGTLSCFDVVNAIKEKDINVTLSLPVGKNAAKEKADEIKINTLDSAVTPIVFGYYNGGSSLYKVFLKFLFSLKHIRKWKQILLQNKPDVVILNSIVQWPMIPLLNRLEIKNVCFVRETMRGKPNKIINKIISFYLNKATGVAFLSNFDKNQWSLTGKVIQTIIPDLVDLDMFKVGINKEDTRKKLNLKNDVFYILYVGGMNELKGARTIIRAINNCKEENIKLLFLGDLGFDIANSKGFKRIKNRKRIQFINEINKYIEDNSLNSRIQFAGIQANMNYWYAACDVVVFPAEKAHQARPIYEAGVFKKPIVASNFSNYKEYLKPELSGLVFEPGDYKGLSNAINRLYQNRLLCSVLGENNYDLMDKYHNSKKINNKINDFIQNVASS